MANGQGFINLQQAVKDLADQVALTTAALQDLKNQSGDKDSDVQAVADNLNSVTQALKEATINTAG